MNNRLNRRLSRAVADGVTDGTLPVHGAKKIGFIGLSSGAGVTTLVQAVADCLVATLRSKSSRKGSVSPQEMGMAAAAVVEVAGSLAAGSTLPFDKIDIGKHFAGRTYHPLHRLLSGGKPISHLQNISGGVNWALRMPADSDFELEAADLVSLVNNVPAKYVLSDISSSGLGMDYRRLLSQMHRIVLVIDPLPSCLLAGKEIAELVRAAELSGIPVTRVVNKMNDGVNMKEVRRFLGKTPDLFLPVFDFASVYRAEFACKTVYSEKPIAPHIEALTKLIL
ncbi:MAG: hypothetical protein LBN34_00955 [Clostridiales Family XIII bacterium]|jgi:Flp pilus assembly CpaE family ATPase|nr:hypothetical protein [Clostridiales Family XIII bacterium]